MGSLVARAHQAAGHAGARILWRGGTGGRRSDGRKARRHGQRGDACELRPLPPVPAGRSAHLPESAHHRHRSRWRVRGICKNSRVEYLETRSGHSGALRRDTRSAGKRGAYRARGSHCGTNGAGHRVRADRTDGHRGGQSVRKLHGFCHGNKCATARDGARRWARTW